MVKDILEKIVDFLLWFWSYLIKPFSTAVMILFLLILIVMILAPVVTIFIILIGL
jgi:hypothetical protein